MQWYTKSRALNYSVYEREAAEVDLLVASKNRHHAYLCVVHEIESIRLAATCKREEAEATRLPSLMLCFEGYNEWEKNWCH